MSTAGGVARLSGDITTRQIIFDASYSTTAVKPEDPALINVTGRSFWLISNLNFDSSNLGAVRNACVRVTESSRSILTDCGFLRGSTSGTECIGSFSDSYFTLGGTTILEGTTANPIYYFIRSENASIAGGTINVNPNFPGDLNVIASGGAFVYGVSSSMNINFGSPANNVNGSGTIAELQGNTIATLAYPPGTTMSNNISTESLLV